MVINSSERLLQSQTCTLKSRLDGLTSHTFIDVRVLTFCLHGIFYIYIYIYIYIYYITHTHTHTHIILILRRAVSFKLLIIPAASHVTRANYHFRK